MMEANDSSFYQKDEALVEAGENQTTSAEVQKEPEPKVSETEFNSS
jgi:hypothetical protein